VTDVPPAPDAPAYKLVEKLSDEYSVVRSRVSDRCFVSWYDPAARLVRRASLKTKKASVATAVVQGLVDRKITGDPRPHLKPKRFTTVNEMRI